jgi:hypothetical protein
MSPFSVDKGIQNYYDRQDRKEIQYHKIYKNYMIYGCDYGIGDSDMFMTISDIERINKAMKNLKLICKTFDAYIKLPNGNFILKTFYPIIYNTIGHKHMIVCPDGVRYNSNESIPYFISVESDKVKEQGITLGNIIKNTSKFVEYLESIMEPNINFDNE